MNTARLSFLALWCGIVLAGCSEEKTATQRSVPAGQDSQESKHSNRESAFAFPGQGHNGSREHGQPAGARGIAFVDVAAERGLCHDWPVQPRPMTALDAFGCGCATFDGDNDGWQDILLICDPHPKLFRNVGEGNFEDVTSLSGLTAETGDWGGCAVGDYDADGLLDILLTGYHRLALYKNVGQLRFQAVTAEAGLDPSNDSLWASSAGFMDFDGDGWLDLVVLNYVVFNEHSQQYCEYAPGHRSGCNPKIYPPEQGRIWRNTGSGGFQAVPSALGMRDTHGVALVLAFSDLDMDGRIDFYVGNDGVPADLMQNRGHMRFENIAPLAGVAVSDNSSAVSAMGADWADFDRDGRADLVVSNWQGEGFVLFRGLGGNLFADCAPQTGLSRGTKNRMGFGAKWVDFENDGWPDLFFVNGHVYDNSAEIHGPGVPFRQPLGLFANQHGKRFIDVAPNLGEDVQRTMVGRGSATADFNNDGRIDLLAVDYEGAAMLLENRSETKNHWLTLDLRGAAPNHFAYGAHVVGKAGERVWLADVSPASSYLSSSDPRIHWGLGELTQLDSLSIRWPSGVEQTLTWIAADQILKIVEEDESR